MMLTEDVRTWQRVTLRFYLSKMTFERQSNTDTIVFPCEAQKSIFGMETEYIGK